MSYKAGDKILVTTSDWFTAPDGESYKAAHGTFKGIHDDSETLGIRTNRGSSNWYLEIGNMIIAGCQVHYCIRTDVVSYIPPTRQIEHEGKLLNPREATTRIYNADGVHK